jgi:glutamate/tyrosine decarboxylase-like PLP-dependent enzyme
MRHDRGVTEEGYVTARLAVGACRREPRAAPASDAGDGHAQRLAERIHASDDFELLADAPLNIVCFRYRPAGVSEDTLDDLNLRLGAAVLEDGRVYVGTTRWTGRVAFRPAFVNWRTSEQDVDLLLDVLAELGERLQPFV